MFNEKETTAGKKCQQNSGRQRADHHAVADFSFCFVCAAKCKREETSKQVATYATETGEGARDREKQEWIKKKTAAKSWCKEQPDPRVLAICSIWCLPFLSQQKVEFPV